MAKITIGRINPGIAKAQLAEDDGIYIPRKQDADEVLSILRKEHFIALTGSEKIGKTLLLEKEILPILKSGYKARAGMNWKIVHITPSETSLQSFTEAITEQGILYPKERKNTPYFELEVGYELLHEEIGLDGIYKKYIHLQKYNLLVVIDGLEHLLLKCTDILEIHTLLRIIVKSYTQKEAAIYFAIVLRPEPFQKAWANYLNLLEEERQNKIYDPLPEQMIYTAKVFEQIIQNNNYLLKTYSQAELETAIRLYFSARYNMRIFPEKCQQLAIDLYKYDDQLFQLKVRTYQPIEQWGEKRGITAEKKSTETPSDLDKKTKEVSNPVTDDTHSPLLNLSSKTPQEAANILLSSMPDEKQELTAQVFKILVKKNSNDNSLILYPTKFSAIVSITGSKKEDVFTLIEQLKNEYPLLRYNTKTLQDVTEISLASVALLKDWKRLSDWAWEEYELALLFADLSNDAAAYYAGDTKELWAETQCYAMRKQIQAYNINESWANQYGLMYKEAILYLEESEAKTKAPTPEIRKKIVLQQDKPEPIKEETPPPPIIEEKPIETIVLPKEEPIKETNELPPTNDEKEPEPLIDEPPKTIILPSNEDKKEITEQPIRPKIVIKRKE